MSGRLLTAAYTSLVTVISSLYVNFIFITLLIRHLLTDRMRRLNNPSHYGAWERLYLHFIPCLALNCFNALPLNVFPLSETINFGIPRRAINLLWLRKYAAVARSGKIILNVSSLMMHKLLCWCNSWSFVYPWGVLWCKLDRIDLLLLLWMLALPLLWIPAGDSLQVMDTVILLIFGTINICWEIS